MQDDAELLEQWRQGDLRAGQRLCERYFDQVARFFANKVALDHEDLIQETFIACVRGRDRIYDDSRFRSYLFSTAYNVLKKYYTRNAGPRRAEELESCSAQDLAPGPSTLLRNNERDRLLLDALRQIPLELQVVLEMTYWEGMASAEIGEVLGISAATVRTRAFRGREKLVQLLSKSARRVRLDDAPLDDQRLDAWALEVRGILDAELGA